jgi:hypothetical protein
MSSVIVDGIDFVLDLARGNKSRVGSVDRSAMSSSIMLCYLGFLMFWCFVWALRTNRHFSSVATIGAVLQCLGLTVMSIKVQGQKSVKGLSSQMLVMMFMMLCMRLTCTCVANGYIPVDKSGDKMYQLMDIGSLVNVVHLLYCVHKTYVHSYQEEQDSLPIIPMIPPCIVLACFVHGWFNKSFFFDSLWAVSLNVETLILLPQLWMMANIEGKVRGMTTHFVAFWIASRVCYFTFWRYAHEELKKKDDEDDPNISGKYIIVAYALQLVLCGDLAHYYLEAWMGGSLGDKSTKGRSELEL